jgi:hypothetical protein
MSVSGSEDWIELFLEYTDGLPTPDIFRLWSGIAAVAGALERRVWIETARSRLYPNMYVLLVGRPGVGKSQAIAPVGDLWRQTKEVHVAPDNLTKAALIDAIATSSRRLIRGDTEMVEWHSLAVASSEFGVLVPAHDLEFLNTLNHVYDNPTSYRENRRSMGDNQIDISNPQLNIIGGTQPAYLANLLPEEAWGMGFTARLMLIYSGETKKVSLFKKQEPRPDGYKKLVDKMTAMTKRFGAISFELDAQIEAERWADEGCPPVPEHSKLENYTSRRILHALKLAIISAVSGARSSVTFFDFARARDWLLHAESQMPDIFREMVARSDVQVIQELHFFCWQLWIKNKQPIHESRLIHFLQNRVPSEKIMRVIEIAERSGILEAGEYPHTYRPRPKHEHGTE